MVESTVGPGSVYCLSTQFCILALVIEISKLAHFVIHIW